jgi:hypothetical protein
VSAATLERLKQEVCQLTRHDRFLLRQFLEELDDYAELEMLTEEIRAQAPDLTWEEVMEETAQAITEVQ